MTRCQIQSTPVAPGQWRHRCTRCGRDKLAPVAMAVYPCTAACRHLGRPLLVGADEAPLTALVPCRGCGAGEKPYTVWACSHCMTGGRCIPHWRPAPDDLAAYRQRAASLAICDACDYFEALTLADPARTTDNGTAGTEAQGPSKEATE